MKSQIKRTFSNFFFEYETPRQVLVRNKRVAVVCRIIQMGVLAYIIGWVFMYEKGYQIVDIAISSIFTKMKGVSFTNISEKERIWDAADYVFPEQGDSSFVVMTNYIATVGQKQDKCPELPDGKNKCTSDAHCDEGKYKRMGNGHMTGRCINDTSTCEIYSWCPVEDDRKIPDPPVLLTAENYTLFIKNSITFRQFNVVRSNLVESVNQSYINTCLYHPKTDPLCPIFRLGDIVERSGFSFSEIARVGGAIGVLIDWDCNLDLSIRHCKPKYEFYGLYGTGKNEDKEEKPSLGYNFRYAKYYVENGVEKRTLMKVFGVRIDIIVHGRAGKFDIIPTLTAIGSGVGIFGVATVVCDLLLLYFVPERDFYKNMKFKHTEIGEEKPALPQSKTERDLPKE
ncbi:P2X purinoceptor 1 isoform X4 [Sinocyclocheilus rhinocerous]|uniref:P2X purinoceptor 1 isoform X4 n=1 Tax=Sinocyclocheilus rhinocerous TaxID=307959 RepID=UPI0007B79A4B|nr:PREDICTED: P2X purinoceptor 1 isoform X4 [Sinocyclocheilus rhinocerous]